MKIRYFFIGLFFLVAGPVWAQGQLRDNIYLVNETSVGNVEIVDVNKKKVKVRNQNGREFNYKTREVLMAFNENGKYLTFPNTPQQVKNFLSEEEKEARADLIVTVSGQLIPVDIKKDNGPEIRYDDLVTAEVNKNLSTNEVAAIIYKKGNHRLFASPSTVSNILARQEEKVLNARQASYQPAEKSAANVFSSDYQGEKAMAKNKPAEPSVPSKEVSPGKASLEIDPGVYSEKALQKTADLGTYLAIISDRTNSMAEANKAVELAVKLFINEDAQVEVSSKEGRKRYKIRPYLNRLKMLEYDKIEISWSDISYVSDLKKGVDGNYYGVITLQQRFRGFIDNKVVYGDLTEKNIEVKVISYEKETDGQKQQLWDVFLSDVGVVVTKFDQ